MIKKEIFEKLNQSKLDKKEIIIISGASLVAQGIIKKTEDIDICCSVEYYNNINWNKKIGASGIEIKYNDVFEIGYNHYPVQEDIVIINGYKFMNIKEVLKIKKELNREKDKEVIKKLELLVM